MKVVNLRMVLNASILVDEAEGDPEQIASDFVAETVLQAIAEQSGGTDTVVVAECEATSISDPESQ